MHYTRVLTKPEPPPYHNGSIGKRPYTTKVKKRREVAIGHTLNKRCIDLAVKNSLVKVENNNGFCLYACWRRMVAA